MPKHNMFWPPLLTFVFCFVFGPSIQISFDKRLTWHGMPTDKEFQNATKPTDLLLLLPKPKKRSPSNCLLLMMGDASGRWRWGGALPNGAKEKERLFGIPRWEFGGSFFSFLLEEESFWWQQSSSSSSSSCFGTSWLAYSHFNNFEAFLWIRKLFVTRKVCYNNTCTYCICDLLRENCLIILTCNENKQFFQSLWYPT